MLPEWLVFRSHPVMKHEVPAEPPAHADERRADHFEREHWNAERVIGSRRATHDERRTARHGIKRNE